MRRACTALRERGKFFGKRRRVSLSVRDVFGFEPDERIVLSVCAVRDGDAWLLRHGSLLIVPEAFASVSWGAWHREHGGGLGTPLGPLRPRLSVSGDNCRETYDALAARCSPFPPGGRSVSFVSPGPLNGHAGGATHSLGSCRRTHVS